MKLYQVVMEREGETTKSPGKTATELIREELWFAAGSMDQVWVATDWIRVSEECTLISINEAVSAVVVLGEKS